MELAKIEMQSALSEWVTKKVKFEHHQIELIKMHSFNNTEEDFNLPDDIKKTDIDIENNDITRN